MGVERNREIVSESFLERVDRKVAKEFRIINWILISVVILSTLIVLYLFY